MNSKRTINIPPQGRTVAVVGDVYRFLATGEETNGKYALWEALVPPGGGPPPHVHSREEEGFYILEGEISFMVNGERIVAKAGTFANIPVGTPHSFKNECDRPAKMLISVAPAGLERMFVEVGVPLGRGSDDGWAANEGGDREVTRRRPEVRDRNPAARSWMIAPDSLGGKAPDSLVPACRSTAGDCASQPQWQRECPRPC